MGLRGLRGDDDPILDTPSLRAHPAPHLVRGPVQEAGSYTGVKHRFSGWRNDFRAAIQRGLMKPGGGGVVL